MNNVINYLAYVPKSLVATASMAVLSVTAIAGPAAMNGIATANEGAVRMEADTKIANVTQGDESYSDSVDAKVDDIVKVQLWYHNMEDWDSGKTADNLRASVDIPKSQGQNQTITTSLSADNELDFTPASNFSADVNLSLEHAFLEYEEGTAKWRHNQGAADGREECITKHEPIPDDDPNDCYTTDPISDDIVSDGGVLIEDEYQPSFEYQSTITVEARVRADAVKINKEVRNVTEGEEDFTVENTASPGDELEYRIRFENMGNTVLEDVMVGDNLPKYTSYVEDSTRLINMNTGAEGRDIENNNVTEGGINVGHYEPGSVGYVDLRAEIDPINVFEQCGIYTLHNVGVVRPDGMNEFYNTAHTDVDIPCEEPEDKFARCVDLSASATSGKPGLEVDFEAEFDSENLEVEGFTINYGDGNTDQVTGTSANHTYDEVGEYEARVTNIITDDGTKDVDHDDCVVTITVDEKPVDEEVPEQLPEAGFGGPLAALFGSGALGASIRSWLASRRKLSESLLG